MKITKEIKDIIIKRLFISLGILLFIRIGTFLPVPGINHTDLAFYIQKHSVTKSLVSTFSGNNTFVIGIFTLNIFPYINASILVQLLVSFSNKLGKLQKEGDFESRRLINRLIRFITLVWAVIQSTTVALYLKQVLFDWNFILAFEIVIWLTTGAVIVLWLSELITDYGLGNGASLLIYTNIISNLPNLYDKLTSENNEIFTIYSGFTILLLIFIALYGTVFLQEGLRIIPLISSKQLNQGYLKNSGTIENYIPLRFNQAGVMPIILTTTILVFPSYLNNLGLFSKLNLPDLGLLSKIIYWIVYLTLILLFSSFYSTVVLNPKDIADQLQKMTVAIPGIRPGNQTGFYLKKVMNRLTMLGAFILALLAILPNLIEATLKISNLNGLSTTSLLIMGGVLVDITKEIEDIIYSNVYKKDTFKL